MLREGVRQFERYIREHGRPDVIHAHCIFYAGLLASRIHKIFRIPFILTEHYSGFLRNKIPPQKLDLVGHVLRSADRSFAVSEKLQGVLKRLEPTRKVDICENLVRTDYFVPSETRPPLSPFRFAAIGGLNSNKGIELLLESFALAFRGKSALLDIGGDGPEKEFLMHRAFELQLGQQVRFLGSLSRDEVRFLLQQSHVVVSSSYAETFGITLIEAMACGKPVVATLSGGPESFVNERNGILVPTGDVTQLAGAMRRIRENYERYDAGEIRRYCVEHFSEQAIVTKLTKAFESVRIR